MTDCDRSQIYLEMSKDLIRIALELKHPAINITDADTLHAWNDRFQKTCVQMGLDPYAKTEVPR